MILKLSFTDAKLFFDSDTNFNKDKIKYKFIEPITYHQIGNMLHVLMNERPVPTIRETKVPYSLDKNIMDIAKKSIISYTPQIYSLKYNSKRESKYGVNYEMGQGNKSQYNSHSKNNSMSWQRFIDLYGVEYFDKFTKVLKECNVGFKSSDETSFIELRGLFDKYKKESTTNKTDEEKEIIIENNELNKYIKTNPLLNKYSKLKKLLLEGNGFSKKKLGDTKTFNYLFNDAKSSESAYNQSSYTPNTPKIFKINNIRSVIKWKKYSGLIYVPIDETYLRKIRNSKGFATLLDGGIVRIEGIIDNLLDEKLNNPIYLNQINSEKILESEYFENRKKKKNEN